MKKWPYVVKPLSTEEIRLAITDDSWQRFRLSLKGLTTEDKLDRLNAYRQNLLNNGYLIAQRRTREVEVRVDNYINALKRGGQLNMELEVVR